MQYHRSSLAGIAALYLSAGCALLFSQSSTGRVTGSVADATEAAVPGATVKLLMVGSTAPMQTTTTSADGVFAFSTVQPGSYSVSVESSGFAKYLYSPVIVNPAIETALPAIRLDLQSVQQAVEVSGDVQLLQTSNMEVSNTVTQQQVTNLPVLDRQVSTLFLTQPGVSVGRGPSTVNGLRTSMVNVTFEGVNIQDNFIRTNSLDYIPNKFTIEQVAELSITTSNANASVGGGAAQITQVAPSGSNSFHGNGYWYNRNNHFAANDWFNNKAGVGVPFLNLNQLGGSVGGRIVKDKLFFYSNYDAYRDHEQNTSLRTILTPAARQGIFQYRDRSGALQSVNVLSAKNIQEDSYIKNLISQTPANGNTNDAGDGLNTIGYRFNQRANEIRDSVTAKMDYIPSPKHAISGTFVWNRDQVDRPDLDNTFNVVPAVYNNNNTKLGSVSWRWSIRPTLNNEFRAGVLLAPGSFAVNQAYPKYLIGDNTEQTAIGLTPANVGLFINNPQNTFLAQGRQTNTYNWQDNMNWVKGKHNIYFGIQSQLVHTNPYNDAYIVPIYNIGLPASNNTGFTSTELTGISTGDLATANNLYALMGGLVNDYSQTFNITSRTSGYVSGATNLRHFTYGTYAGYFQDNWKILRNVTLNLGLRYDYYARVTETDSLTLLPQVVNNNFITTLMSNATLNFAGNSVGRPYYNKDLNNFAPNVGFAWDVFGKGKTVLRGGYSVAYVNDDLVTSARTDAVSAAGLSSAATNSSVAGNISSPPSIPTPAFQVPRLMSDNYALNQQNTTALPNPDLRTPYVQQWSFGVEHDVYGSVVSVRYVGNHGTSLLRQIDYNQISYPSAFLADFIRARSNLLQNGSATVGQPLTYLPTLPQGGSLTNSTVINNIRTGAVAELANYYSIRPSLYPGANFFPNPFTQTAYSLNNISNSTYNSLQVDIRKRTQHGVYLQFSYVYSKAMGDGSGDNQSRTEPLLDNNNLGLEHSREPFDLTHVFHANYAIELPFGAGKKFQAGPILNQIIGGWTYSGIWQYTSGTPFSIFSGRGTFNRSARSVVNTVNTSLNKDQLDQVTGFFMTGNGPYFISPSVIGPDGRGVAADGAAPFTAQQALIPGTGGPGGQVFFNPDPGTIGTLQRRYFSGPWDFGWDMSLSKMVRIKERHSIQLRMETFNTFNHPAFYVGNESANGGGGSGSSPTRFTVNNTTFGRITSVLGAGTNGPRRVQFGLYYRF